MKKLTQIILVLFTAILTPTVSWGSVDGKGIWCKGDDNKNSKLHTDRVYHFKKGTVEKHHFILGTDEKFTVHRELEGKFKVTPQNIMWGEVYNKTLLDRKNLQLISRYDWSEGDRVYFLCEVYTEKDFFNKLEDVKNKLQSEYDDKTKDNKI